jgi:hypothetical protein
MMRLPARLTTKLARVRIAQIFSSAPESSLLYCVDPGAILHPGADAPVSREKMQELITNRAPVVWVGGSEPLRHPGVGHFVRAVARGGHFVFLETDGTLLRRRIHEFPPLPQLFLTVRLRSFEESGSAFAVEGLRAARLSGFFTVIHSPVHEEADLAQLSLLRAFLLKNDVDGWLITAGSSDQAIGRKTAEARILIPGNFWRQFSEDVEGALRSQTPEREWKGAQASLTATPHPEAGEEGVGIA